MGDSDQVGSDDEFADDDASDDEDALARRHPPERAEPPRGPDDDDHEAVPLRVLQEASGGAMTVRLVRIAVLIATLGACSVFNREGPDLTCEDLAGGEINACKDGIIAACDGATVRYQVCTEKSACEQPWQTSARYRCADTEPLPELKSK